jgi:hypothetical protein
MRLPMPCCPFLVAVTRRRGSIPLVSRLVIHELPMVVRSRVAFAFDGRFNRSTQRIGQNVLLVFRS